jgi:hypothetical protein
MLPIPTRIMVEKGDHPRESISKVMAGKGKTTVKTLISSTMKKTVRSVPKCLSMKSKF